MKWPKLSHTISLRELLVACTILALLFSAYRAQRELEEWKSVYTLPGLETHLAFKAPKLHGSTVHKDRVGVNAVLYHTENVKFKNPLTCNIRVVQTRTDEVVGEVVDLAMSETRQGHDFATYVTPTKPNFEPGTYLVIVEVLDGRTLVVDACTAFQISAP